jgi:DNA-binding MarR family transcriptional regulator
VVLMTLRDGIARTCADIARHMNHDSGATTRLVDQLEARGFVTRSRSTSDRRVVNLGLTAEGRSVARRLTPHIVEFWNEVLGSFSHEEASSLVALMKKLLLRLESVPSNAEPQTTAKLRAIR